MNYEKIQLQTCCGTISVLFRLSSPISDEFLTKLSNNGFKENVSFRKAGILYTESDKIIASGPMGSNKLTVNSKKKKVEDIELFEILLKNL